MKGIIIKGTGSYTPNKIVTNEMLGKIVDTSDEWILSRTGIKERKITTNENTSDMAIKSCEVALKNANVDCLDIDLIIVATCTPDSFIPSTACIVQKALGCDNAVSFDISAACTGFIFALETAKSLMKVNNYKNALVVGAETLSKIVDWTDRTTCVLFGDGAGSVVLSASEETGIINSVCKTDARKYECLTSYSLDIKNPFTKDFVENKKYLKMDGQEVFKFATNIIVKVINEVLEKSNMTIDDIDYIVPHQANIRIIEHSAKKLKIDKEKFYTNLENYGNTSAASIPIALHELNEKKKLKNGDNIILVGFGGGLTFGAMIVKWCV